jgi:cystathionine beta-lyase
VGGVRLKYNFDKAVNRKNTGCKKWDGLKTWYGEDDLIPMWIADMDFESPPCVVEAIERRAAHGVYGYPIREDSFYEAVTSWMKRHHGFSVDPSWVVPSPGVVPALAFAILAFTNPGDKIIVQSPIYPPFFSVIADNGRQVLVNRLRLEGGKYAMDFDDLERSIDSRTRMILLCNPHNPVGRVWKEEELSKLGEICLKHNITIVSDEIHSDVIYRGNKHIPVATLSPQLLESSITCMAPSKTFNIPGLATAINIIPNEKMRQDFQNVIEGLHLATGNVFGIVALEAAYNRGEEWLKELIDYLENNINFLSSFLKNRIPQIKLIEPEGMFVVWLDCRELPIESAHLKDFFAKEAKVALNDGITFGPGGEGFMRMNVGCPRSTLEEGLLRIEKAVKSL